MWEMTDLQQSIFDNKYTYEEENFEEWLDRVSGGNNKIKERIRNKQFLFGGRILANRGLNKHGLKVTYSNCYVLPSPKDNIESIFDTARDMARTYSYGGGVGISLRHIRPRGARVHNNAKDTSGAVSFMPIYSLTTETIGQHGRRGALMISIPCNHPDLEEFITVKSSEGVIEGANISIEISDRFMLAVKRDELYRLHFTVEDTGEVIEKFIEAKKLYKKIIENNYDWGDPGNLFWDRINDYHLMSADPTFEYAGTNPCGEEPLPEGGSCLLGSNNLSEFVVNPFMDDAYFDFEGYAEAVQDSVVALNEVLDEGLPLHPLEIQRKTVEELRQIGLGIMGIAEMCIKLGLTYGQKESLDLCDKIGEILLNEAVRTSALIAKEKGAFTRYKWENISNSEFFKQNVRPEIKEIVKEYGLRNSQLLTIAPTGSISTMFGISGGIEPVFALEFERTTKSLHGKDVKYKVYADIVNDYLEAKGLTKEDILPEMFVSAMTLDWHDRIHMQSVWQRWIDASISSTVNLPKEISLEEVMDLYIYAWENGLKGCTIFRDGCKKAGILTVQPSDKEEEEEETSEIEEQQYKDGDKPKGFFSTCASCGSENVFFANGCVNCQDCGFSPCS
jgi:ribonucleoside-diphosphate reductase alpha chain